MDFSNSWKENRNKFDFTKDLAKAMYEAGQQSKQDEIDALKEKIDSALDLMRQPMRGTTSDLLADIEDIL